MELADDAALLHRPEAFNGVGVNGSDDVLAALPVVGCRLLKSRPLDPHPDLQPDQGEDLSGTLQSDWIDDQLYRCRPYQQWLASLGDAQFSAMQSAWPEGFHLVVFDDGTRDEDHALELIEPYLEWADHLGLPLLTEFGMTDEEMEQALVDDFALMIRQWRETVISRLERTAS